MGTVEGIGVEGTIEGALEGTVEGGNASQRPLQVVGNLTRAPYATDTTSAGNEMRQQRCPFFLGTSPVTEIWFVVAGWYVELGAGGREFNVGNDFAAILALEYNGQTKYCPLATQAAPFTVVNGSTHLIGPYFATDFGLSEFPANAAMFSRMCSTVAAGLNLPRTGQYMSEGPASRLNSAAGANQISATGVFTGANNQVGPTPMMVIGRTTAPQVSIIEVGDSIGEGQNDSNQFPNASNGGGYFQRGAWNTNKTSIAQLGRHGATLAAYVNFSAKRRALFIYATHIFIEFGTNDMFLPTTATLFLDNLATAVAAAKAAMVLNPAKWVCCITVGPRTATAWTLADGSDQTATPSWNYTGVGDVNTALAAFAPGNDAFFDVNPDFGLAGSYLKWFANGTPTFATPDGTHPQTTVDAPCGVRMTTLMNTLVKY